MRRSDRRDTSHRLIEQNLRRVYQETVDEEVPGRFRDLLSRLKQGDAKSDMTDASRSKGNGDTK